MRANLSTFSDVLENMGDVLSGIRPNSRARTRSVRAVLVNDLTGNGSVYSCVKDCNSNYRGRIALVERLSVKEGMGWVFAVGVVRTIKKVEGGYNWVFFKVNRIRAFECDLGSDKLFFDVDIDEEMLKGV